MIQGDSRKRAESLCFHQKLNKYDYIRDIKTMLTVKEMCFKISQVKIRSNISDSRRRNVF